MPGAAFPIPTTWSDDDDDKEDRKSDKIRRKFDLETTGGLPGYQTQSLGPRFRKEMKVKSYDTAQAY